MWTEYQDRNLYSNIIVWRYNKSWAKEYIAADAISILPNNGSQHNTHKYNDAMVTMS